MNNVRLQSDISQVDIQILNENNLKLTQIKL